MESVENFKKVELHVHLDGAARHSTLYELAKAKNLPLPGDGTLEDLKNATVITEGISLYHFLSPYKFYNEYYRGDLDAVERFAYEFIEDCSKNNVVYVEVRYMPHKLLGTELCQELGYEGLKETVRRVYQGLSRGEEDFKVRSKSILSCATRWPVDTIHDVLRLAQECRDYGVVGIDLLSIQAKEGPHEEAPVMSNIVQMYEEARKCGIKTTIHAGEASGAASIQRAMDVYHTDRVGHGYRVVEDNNIYTSCLQRKIHIECCPYSSYLTGAVPFSTRTHPIAQFAKDNANFSLSSDDPTLTGKYLNEDYKLAQSWGFNKEQFKIINLNAAEASFQSDHEKKELIKLLESAYSDNRNGSIC
uniref:Adenosine deaminase n=1 Tax=Cacopsylla melanoneura TaxID=428564 RepID=A0A8D8Y9K5_9HEMI